ncbi:MAG TPA: cation:proton antiporter [Candidatus Binatia bacterium]
MSAPWVFIVSFISLSMMAVAIMLAAFRLIRGPSLPDRVVALDLISILAAGVTAIYAIASGQAVFLDVATILALVSFLGTVAFARYLEKQVSQ